MFISEQFSLQPIVKHYYGVSVKISVVLIVNVYFRINSQCSLE